MRQTISGLFAAIALTTAGAAPAMACGYAGPCAQTYAPGYSYYTYTGCGTCGGWDYDRLTDPETQYHSVEPSPQYYYINQGPTFTGPAAFAPYPTYQDSAVSGWDAYARRPYYYGHDSGRYANATNHYYDGAGVEGPRLTSYRWRHHYSFRPRHRYRHGYAPHHHAVHYGYHYGRPVLRRYD
jgi:hypothetical protein